MPEEYDAFGRKVGDDPLGGLGWSSETTEQAPSVEVDTSPSVETPPPAHTPPPVQFRSSGGGRGRLLVVVAVLGGLGAGTYALVNAATDTVRDVAEGVRRAIPTVPAVPEVPAAEDDAPRPSRPASLIGRQELGGALRRLRRDVPGRLRTLRLEASRIDVTVHLSGGRLRSAQYQAGAQAAQVFNTTAGGFPATGTYRYADVDPAAPGRLIRAAGERLDRGPGKVNYLVFSSFGETLQWGVYYKDGAIAIGDARGRFLRQIS